MADLDENKTMETENDEEMADNSISDEDDNSSDSEDDMDADLDDSELKLKADKLQEQLDSNPFLYDNHVELIKTRRQLGDLEALRSARQKMSDIYPLTEELWLEWLQDEVGLVSDDEGREQVTKLFEKAVKDYLSVPVWLEYVQFSIGGMAQTDGMTKIRETFDRALIYCGLHVTKGGNLWEAYREFENAIMVGLLPAPGSVPTKEQEDKFSVQHDRVHALFKRQLAVPLQGIKETYGEYKDWLQDEPDKQLKQSYNKALIQLEKLQPYEQKLLSVNPPRLAEYQEYIKFEEKGGDPSRIQCLYERAIQENCLNPEIWLQYTKYLDHVLRVSSLSVDVYARSIRNCPWSVQLWQNYILTLERSQQSYEQVKGVFEAALTSGFTQGSEYLSLWTTFVDYLRRKIHWEKDHQEDLDTFRLTIEKAIEQLDSFGAEGDPNGTLRQLWAAIEAKYCKNLEKGRELWSEIMASGRANEAALWMENYRFERQYGDNKHCRKVLQRALNSVTDWPESIVDAYVNFERLEGTLEQYELAMSKCEAQMNRIIERREKESGNQEPKKKFDKKGPQQKGKGRQFDKQQNKQQNRSQQQQQQPNKQQQHQGKRQHQEEQVTDIKPYKRKNTGEAMDMSDKSFKAPLPVSPKPPNKPKSAPPPGYKPDGDNTDGQKTRSAPPPGFKGHDDSSVTPPAGSKRELEKGPPPGYKEENGEGEPEVKKQKTDADTRVPSAVEQVTTAFVSNLNFKVDEDQLRDFFKKCGQIEEIRLIKNFKGHSKGYAYIQFTDQLAVANALTYDRTPIDGRPMFVSKYEDRAASNKAKADFKYSTNLEKNKLFIKNLPFTCNKDALMTLFSQHGEIKDIRMVTYRSGAPKGLAYVEYVDQQDAAQALMKTDGLKIGENEISVAISNPPTRKAPLTQRDESSFVPTLGGGKKETQSRGVARTQVMLMPRAVSKKPVKPSSTTAASSSTGESASSSESASDKKPGMSNSDFRNMLLKK